MDVVFHDLRSLCSHFGGSLCGKTISFDGQELSSGTVECGIDAGRHLSFNQPIWPELQCTQASESSESWHATDSLFTLSEPPEGARICTVAAPGARLENGVLRLGANACLLLNSSCSDVRIANMTFEGGAVVCLGSGCSAEFSNATFRNCTLVATCGAQATITTSTFIRTASPPEGVNIFANGAGTSIRCRSTSITGGSLGIHASDGAAVHAKDVTMDSLAWAGVEATDQGTSVELSRCHIRDQVHALQEGCTEQGQQNGVGDIADMVPREVINSAVLARRGCAVTLEDIDVIGTGVGLHMSGGTRVTGARISVTGAVRAAVECIDGASIQLDGASVQGVRGCGVIVFGKGTEADIRGGSITGCRHAGCKVNAARAVITDSMIAEVGGCGVVVTNRGSAECLNVKVSSSGGSGYVYNDGSKGTMTSCEAFSCGQNGLACEDRRTEVTAVQCRFINCGACGALASEQAQLYVTGCEVECGKLDGFWARKGARMRVEGSRSKAAGESGCGGSGARVECRGVQVTLSRHCGYSFQDGAEAVLDDCSADSSEMHGLMSHGEGTKVQVHDTKFQSNSCCGALVTSGAKLSLEGCTCDGNRQNGCWAYRTAQLNVTTSVIKNSGKRGCGGTGDVAVSCTGVEVQDSGLDGLLFQDGAKGSLVGCSASGNAWNGLSCKGSGTFVSADRCHFVSNGECGMNAAVEGVLTGTDCCCVDSKTHGLCAQSMAKMTLVNCASSQSTLSGCHASSGSVVKCSGVMVRRCGHHGFAFQEGATATLQECTSIQCNGNGLVGDICGTDVRGEKCVFSHNRKSGAVALGESTLKLVGCTSERNHMHGFMAQGKGRMRLTDCVSNGAGQCGCMAKEGAVVRCTKVEAVGSGRHGFEFRERSVGDLNSCCAAGSNKQGIISRHPGSTVQAKGCKVTGSGSCGAVATGSGELKLEKCTVEKSTQAGFWAHCKGRLEVQECSCSEAGTSGCGGEGSSVVRCTRTQVRGSTIHGYEFRDGAAAFLDGCVSTRNGGCGLTSKGAGTNVLAEGCTFAGNGEAGTRAVLSGALELTKCTSDGIKASGTWVGSEITPGWSCARSPVARTAELRV